MSKKGSKKTTNKSKAKKDKNSNGSKVSKTSTMPTSNLATINIEDLLINSQVRNEIKEDQGFKELKNSIKTQGFLGTIVVAKEGKKYKIVAGHRRLKALQQLKYKAVPCTIVDSDDTSQKIFQLLENTARVNLNDFEIAEFVKRLTSHKKDGKKLTQREIATALGMQEANLSSLLNINKIPKEVREDIQKQDVMPSTGYLIKLASCDDIPYAWKQTKANPKIKELQNSVEEGVKTKEPPYVISKHFKRSELQEILEGLPDEEYFRLFKPSKIKEFKQF